MKKITVSLLTLAALCSAASAVPIVSYSFDTPPYVVGSDLVGQQGWTGDPGYVAGNVTVSSTGLTNAGMLGASGGSITGVSDFAAGKEASTIGPTVGTDTETGAGERWFAALLTLTGNGGSPESNFVNLSFDSSSTSGFVFGLYSGGAGGAGTSSGYSFQFGGQSTNAGSSNFASAAGFTGSQYVGGTTALVVGRMTVTSTAGATNETFDFWLNPTDATSVATLTSTAQGTMTRNDYSAVVGNWGAFRAGSQMGGSNGLGFMQDEIRAGLALSDLNLVTVPEPKLGWLIGIGILTLSFVHRRRRLRA